MFSTFNPSAMSTDALEDSFVQRKAIAERLVDVFEESALRVSKHNVLLVGPRGIGKSHLIALVYHRLKAKAGLKDKLSIAYLREDEWGINSFLDLLLRIIAVVCEEKKVELPKQLDSLSALDRTQAEDQAWSCLKEVIEKTTLLIIAENLDAIFAKIGEQGQSKWRALMQTNPQWAILGSTPALFAGISRQVSPFYGFFEVVHLQPLSLDDGVALLQSLARRDKDAGDRSVRYRGGESARAGGSAFGRWQPQDFRSFLRFSASGRGWAVCRAAAQDHRRSNTVLSGSDGTTFSTATEDRQFSM